MKIHKVEPKLKMLDYWEKAIFQNYANFKGRASRKEYWYFQLANLILGIILAISFLFLAMLMKIEQEPLAKVLDKIFILIMILILIPNTALSIRRLQDTNKPGWLCLISLIPYLGGIILFGLCARKGTKGENQYGEDPNK